MATLQQLESALVKADAAGDVDGAKILAGEVRKLRNPVKQIDINGPKGAASESAWENAAAGVGKAIYDTGRGLGQLTGLVSSDDVKESRRLDKDLMDTGAGFAGNVVGNIGIALAPGGVLKGAGMAANALSAPGKAQALSAIGGSLLAPRSIGGAAALGAGMGVIQPAESLEERAINTGVGGVASAFIPAAVRGFKSVKAAAEPFYESGRNQILARALQEASGGGQYADDALKNLQQAGQRGPFATGLTKGEIVPNSVPTAGQVSKNAGIAALERSATATNPAVTQEVSERLASQNLARVGALDEIAGSDGARQFAKTELQSTADDIYRQAFDRGMDLRRDPLTGAFLSKAQQAGRKSEITKLMQTPALQEAKDRATSLAQNEMISLKDPSGSVQGLHYMKKALDDMISNSSGNEQRVLRNLQKRFLTTVDSLSPDYAAARGVFRDMAGPVNQMETAAEISKRSVTPTGQMTLNKYARALSDDSAQAATGFKKATLSGTMTPESMGTLNNIKEDLTRAEFAKNAGRGTGSDTVQKLAYSNILNQAGVPNFMRNLGPAQIVGNLLSRGGDLAYKDANQRLSEQLAKALLDPAETASLMAIKPNQRTEALVNLLSRGGASAGMMVPALSNSQQ
jgi:hypothetical protein